MREEWMQFMCLMRRYLADVGGSLVGNCPTQFTIGRRPTLIDVLCATRTDRILRIGTSFGQRMNHDILYDSYSFELKLCVEEDRHYRNYSRIDMQSLLSVGFSQPWDSMYQQVSVDDKLDRMHILAVELFDQCVQIVPTIDLDLITMSLTWFFGLGGMCNQTINEHIFEHCEIELPKLSVPLNVAFSVHKSQYWFEQVMEHFS